MVVRNGCSPTRGGSPARCCFRGESDKVLLPWLCDAAFEDMDVLFGPRVSARTLVEVARGERQSSEEGRDW